MRIAHCIHGLGLGGAQKVVATLVRGGSEVEPTVARHFVYSCSGGVLRPEIEQAGAQIRILERRMPKLDPTWVRALRRSIRDDGVDLVHCHLFGDTLHGYLAARPLAIPVMATVHNQFDTTPPLQRFGYRRVLPRLAATVTCGERAQRSLLAALPGVDPVLIRNGIDPVEPDPEASRAAVLELRNDLDIPAQAPLIAAIGRLTEQKAPDFLLESFARSRQQEAHLVFLGDGPLRTGLEATELDDTIRRRVHFAGFRDGILELLPGLDIVVFASDHEGLSIALLEAMATARALVVSEVSGLLEAVSPETEALVVPKRDVEALAKALDTLVADPALRHHLGGAAKRRFESFYSSERMIASYHLLYRRLVDHPTELDPQHPQSHDVQSKTAPMDEY